MTEPLPSPNRSDPPPPLDRRSLNIPNLITVSRLVMAIGLFFLVDQGAYWLSCAVLFIVAAWTDYFDGYLARKWNQKTQLGRILDPFVDKVIVCGAFIFLTARPESGVCAWTTFIVIGREMWVTGLRSILEQSGTDFSAQLSGKLKMVLQSVTIPICLASLSPQLQLSVGEHWPAFLLVRKSALILMIAVTVYSGLEYTIRGLWLLSRPVPPRVG